YAIGDLVGPLLLAHAASAQGMVAVETMAGRRAEGQGLDPSRVPACIYCMPEVAAVGLAEAEARARGHELRVGKFPFRALGKAMASGVLAPASCGVPSGPPRRSSLRLPLSLPGSFASLTMVTRTDS